MTPHKKEHVKKYNKEYYLRNKEQLDEAHRKWKEKNKERVKEWNKKYSREHYLRNKEHKAEYTKKYRLKNKERVKEWNRESYLKKKSKK